MPGDAEPPLTEDERDCLAALEAALRDLAEGRGARTVDERRCSGPARGLVRTLNRVMAQLAEIGRFVQPLARGELSAPLPSPDNRLAAPLTELHAQLRRLTRQAQAVADGDYSQRVEFMGEFARAFNEMVARLAEREAALRAEIERRRAAEELLARERDLLAAGPMVTFRWGEDDACVVEYVSPNVTAFGFTPEEFLSGRRTYADVIHPDDRDWALADGNAKEQAGLEAWTQEYRIIDGQGRVRWVRDYTHVVRREDGGVECYEGYVIDISAEKAAEAALREREERLRGLSLYDDLTGLYNRRGLYAVGEHLLGGARVRRTRLVAVSADVVGLAALNDAYGFAQGDAVLRTAAEVLRGVATEADVVARVGGDEFVLLCEVGPGGGEGQGGEAAALLTRLRRRLAARLAALPRARRFDLSLGAALWTPAAATRLQDLLDEAERRRLRDRAERDG